MKYYKLHFGYDDPTGCEEAEDEDGCEESEKTLRERENLTYSPKEDTFQSEIKSEDKFTDTWTCWKYSFTEANQ